MRDPVSQAYVARPTRRMMVFADGENLVFRYQDMLKRGFVPRRDIPVAHLQDIYVWHPMFTCLARQHEILRVTYYTYVGGEVARVADVGNALREQRFEKHFASLLPATVTPCVFSKPHRTRKGKGVDIQLAVDVLSQVFRGNVDSILLLSGDGDYSPLLDEVRRAGLLVYVSAFSEGFSPALKERADEVCLLDGIVWS